jgi:hypothetical protein
MIFLDIQKILIGISLLKIAQNPYMYFTIVQFKEYTNIMKFPIVEKDNKSMKFLKHLEIVGYSSQIFNHSWEIISLYNS